MEKEKHDNMLLGEYEDINIREEFLGYKPKVIKVFIELMV